MPRQAAIVLLVYAASAGAQELPPQHVASIDSFIQQTMRERRIPGVAVAVVQEGRTVYRRAFGVANLETETPLTPESVFELASVTKQFTAAAIMMLALEGKVNLDTTIAAYVDSAPPAWSDVTVRHLLNHTSGIFAGGIVQHENSPLLHVTTKQAFRQIAGARAFGSGRTGFYADANYFLLGMIIEKASGQSYRDFMRARIFDPLGMSHTSVTDHRRVIKGRVATYEIADGQHVNWRRVWEYELPSFFGIWSTLDDVAKWDNALRRYTLLRKDALEEMWTPGYLADGRDALVNGRLYGMGFRLLDIRGHRVVSHTGASGTLLLHLREEPISVIVLTNLAGTAGRHHTALGDGIVRILRPAYESAFRVHPIPDPEPARTAALQDLLVTVSTGRESPMMTPAHASYFRALPRIVKDEIHRDLSGLAALTFVTCDDATERGLRFTDPVATVCYYTATAGTRRLLLTFYLTHDGRVSHMRWAGEDLS